MWMTSDNALWADAPVATFRTPGGTMYLSQRHGQSELRRYKVGGRVLQVMTDCSVPTSDEALLSRWTTVWKHDWAARVIQRAWRKMRLYRLRLVTRRFLYEVDCLFLRAERERTHRVRCFASFCTRSGER